MCKRRIVEILIVILVFIATMTTYQNRRDIITIGEQVVQESDKSNMHELARQAVDESIREQQIVWGPHSKKLLDAIVRVDELEKTLIVNPNTPTIEIVAPKIIPGVVHVMCPQWQGSGFVVGPRLIATARHVVEDVTDFTLTTHKGHILKATRAISFKNRDVGFIWIDDLRCVSEVERELECSKVKHEIKLQVLELGSIKECNLGQSVFALGSPYGKVNFNHLSSGIVSALDRSWNELGENYGWEVGWTTTVAGHPGNSGCPIFTLDGKVRGILVGGFSPVLIIAMPVDLFKDHLAEITMIFEMDNFKKEQKTEMVPSAYTSKGENE